MCDVDGSDPFTDAFQLCGDDGVVRRGAMHHGTDYPCTAHAHFAGRHIRCTSRAHQPTQVVGVSGNEFLFATPASVDPRDWHRNWFGTRLTRGWGFGWGRLHGALAREFDASADRHLVQVEVFGRYVNACR